MRDRARREKERQQLADLIGRNLTYISQLTHLTLALYQERVLPRIMEQVGGGGVLGLQLLRPKTRWVLQHFPSLDLLEEGGCTKWLQQLLSAGACECDSGFNNVCDSLLCLLM